MCAVRNYPVFHILYIDQTSVSHKTKEVNSDAKEQQWLIFVDMFRIRRCFVTAKKYKLHTTTKDHSGQKLNSNSLDMFEIFFLQNNMLIFLSL